MSVAAPADDQLARTRKPPLLSFMGARYNLQGYGRSGTFSSNGDVLWLKVIQRQSQHSPNRLRETGSHRLQDQNSGLGGEIQVRSAIGTIKHQITPSGPMPAFANCVRRRMVISSAVEKVGRDVCKSTVQKSRSRREIGNTMRISTK